MWVYKIVDKKIALLFFVGIMGFGIRAEPHSSVLVAQRDSRIQRGYRALPQVQKTFEKVERKKTLLKYVKPPHQSKLYFQQGTDEAQLEQMGLMEIRQLYDLLKTSSRPDLQLRLASLYVEQAQLIESRIYDAYEMELEKYKRNERASVPRLNLKPVREYSQKAINLFQFYLKKYPKSRKIDTILFQLAYSYFRLDQSEKGKAYYERLVRQYPKSEHLEASYFQLGEYYFDRKKWNQAKFNYDRASRLNGRFYSFSAYKMGWCFYNLGQVNMAMKLMEKLVKESQSGRYRRKSQIDFSRNALNDLTSFYIYSKRKASDAVSYFGNLTRNERQLNSLLEKVGFGYKDIGNIRDMRTVFTLLMRLHPYNPKAYDYKYQIVQAYSYAGQTQLFQKEFREWIDDYGRGSTWAKKNSANRRLIKKVHDLQEVLVRNYSFRMHHAFLKTRRESEKSQALFGYQLYFKSFDWASFYPEVRFHYGELLFDIKRYAQAATQYDIVVSQFPKSKVYETALLNRVLALEKVLPSEASVKQFVQNKESPSLPQVVMKFKEAVDDYSQNFPKKKNTPNMLYTLGTVLLEYKQYEWAVEYLVKIVNEYASQNLTFIAPAVHSILDTYNLIGDFEKLEEQGRLFMQMPLIQKSALAKDIRKILREVEFKKAQDLAQSGNLKTSAQMYEKFYRSNSSSSLSITALYNAALNYKKVKNMKKALELYIRLSKSPHLSKYPKIESQVFRILPELYQTQGLYLKAAYAFKRYAQKYPRNKSVGDYWYNAALIFDGLNLYDEAVGAYLKYKDSTASLDKNQVYFLIGRIRERQGQKARAIGNYTAYLNQPDRNKLTQTLTSFRIAQLSSTPAEVQKWMKLTINIHSKNKAGLSFASQARFYLAEQTYKKFKSIRIPQDMKGQERAVQLKLNLLEKLKNEVKSIIKMNDRPRVVASLTLMALANDHLGKSILRSHIPKSLNKADRQTYKEGLAQAAQPFLDGAQTYRKQALAKAKNSDMYMPWIKEAHRLTPSSPFKETTYSIKMLGYR